MKLLLRDGTVLTKRVSDCTTGLAVAAMTLEKQDMAELGRMNMEDQSAFLNRLSNRFQPCIVSPYIPKGG